MNLTKVKERLNSFLDITPDEDWPHQYNSEEINSYYRIVEYLFSDTNIDPVIFPIADGGIGIQYCNGKLSDSIEINIDLDFIVYLCYNKRTEIFITSFEVTTTLESQEVVKNKIKENHATNQA